MIDLWVEQVVGGRAVAHEWANERVATGRGAERTPGPTSLSHHRDWLAVGISSGEPLGVDVLTVPDDADFVADTALVLSPTEIATVRSAPPERRGETFAECWTRKEAYAKLLGTGLTADLPSITLTPVPDDDAVQLWTTRVADAVITVATPGPGAADVRIHCAPDYA